MNRTARTRAGIWGRGIRGGEGEIFFSKIPELQLLVTLGIEITFGTGVRAVIPIPKYRRLIRFAPTLSCPEGMLLRGHVRFFGAS